MKLNVNKELDKVRFDVFCQLLEMVTSDPNFEVKYDKIYFNSFTVREHKEAPETMEVVEIVFQAWEYKENGLGDKYIFTARVAKIGTAGQFGWKKVPWTVEELSVWGIIPEA